MPRADASKLCLRVIQEIFDAAKPMEVDVAGTNVDVQVSQMEQGGWPEGGVSGATEQDDGPWPRGVQLDCTWEGGRAELSVELAPWTSAAKDVDGVFPALVVRRLPRRKMLIHMFPGVRIARADDGDTVQMIASIEMPDRSSQPKERRAELSKALRRLFEESEIPLASTKVAELYTVEVPALSIEPGAEVAFRRLVRTALYKLDFLDAAKTAERGVPLIDLAALGLSTDTAEESNEPEALDMFEDDEDAADDAVTMPPKNLILYGPPGTGKTYQIQRDLMPRFTLGTSDTASRTEELDAFIGGLTWFQVVMLALSELGGEAPVLRLSAQPHVKRKYAMQAPKASVGSYMWNTLQMHAVEESETVRLKKRSNKLVFDKKSDGTWFFPNGEPSVVADLKEQLEQITAKSDNIARNYEFVTFHQAYAYEDFLEGIRPVLDDLEESEGGLRYELSEGVFKRAVRRAIGLTGFEGSTQDFCDLPKGDRKDLLTNAPHYALFIDEINRGNVANIFGELITLLEDDKRLGEENELVVTLPGSGTRFGVPSNLHLIGTMNTADRSVEALDTALRRRFAFRECMPQPELADVKVGLIEIAKMLRTINRRLQALYDRDHVIGHAYLMPLRDDPSLERLKEIFARKIIPLLQEYFYGDWGRIGLVLGKAFVRKVPSATQALADFEHDDADALSDRVTYALTDAKEWTSVSFRRIYEHVSNDN